MTVERYLWIAGMTAVFTIASLVVWLRSDASADAVGEFGPAACALVVVVAALIGGLAWPLVGLAGVVALLIGVRR